LDNREKKPQGTLRQMRGEEGEDLREQIKRGKMGIFTKNGPNNLLQFTRRGHNEGERKKRGP